MNYFTNNWYVDHGVSYIDGFLKVSSSSGYQYKKKNNMKSNAIHINITKTLLAQSRRKLL